MSQSKWLLGSGWILLVLAIAGRADTVQLANGDSLQGEVVALDARQLKLKSELLGELTVPRDKVAAIYLGKARPPAPAAAAAPTRAPAPHAPLGENATPEEILKQIQAGGVNPATVNDLTKAFPLLAQPEVQKYFNDTVGGLMTGKLNVNDIRKQALDVREQLRELEQELGPEGAQALSMYSGILDKFIRDTEPKPPAPRPAPPKQPAAPR